jgi:hypothetical protein
VVAFRCGRRTLITQAHSWQGGDVVRARSVEGSDGELSARIREASQSARGGDGYEQVRHAVVLRTASLAARLLPPRPHILGIGVKP